MSLRAHLPELDSLESMLSGLPAGSVRVLTTARHGDEALPIHAISLGPEDKQLPSIVFVGGVHGLERVGTQVLLSYESCPDSFKRSWKSGCARRSAP